MSIKCLLLGHHWLPSEGWQNPPDSQENPYYWGIDRYYCIRGKHYHDR